MPLFALLDPLSMFIVRRNYNQIKRKYFAKLTPSETISAIETLLQPPLEKQEWFQAVCQHMQSLGINEVSDQKKIIDAIIALFNNKSIVAQKTKDLSVYQNEHLLSNKFRSLTLSTVNKQLESAISGWLEVHTPIERKQALTTALQNGADPNLCFAVNHYFVMPVIFNLVDMGYLGLEEIETVVSMHANLDLTIDDYSLMAKMYRRFYFARDKIDENLKIFEFLLGYGVDPESNGAIHDHVVDSSILLSVVKDFVSSHDAFGEQPYLKLIEMLLNYGADVTTALEYAVKTQCDKAKAVLEPYRVMRLTPRERQLLNAQTVINQPQLNSVPLRTESNDLIVYQDTAAHPARLVLGEPQQVSANTVTINGQSLIKLVVDQLGKFGITHNELALASHAVQLQSVNPLLSGFSNPGGMAMITARYAPGNIQANKTLLAIHVVEGMIVSQCQFISQRSEPNIRDVAVTHSEIEEDSRYIMGAQNLPAIIVPPTYNEFLIFIALDEKDCSALPQSDIRQAALSLSNQTIRVYKISSVVVKLSEKDFKNDRVTLYADRLLSLARARALQSTQQMKDKNITEVVKDYSYNGFRDKLKLILFPYGITILDNKSESFSDFVAFIEPLLLKHGIARELKYCFRNAQPNFPGDLILNLDLSDLDIMNFIGNLNEYWGWGTAKRCAEYDRVTDVQLRAISLNLAVLIDKVLPEFEKFIKDIFHNNVVLKKCYQFLGKSFDMTIFSTLAEIKKKFELASGSYGLTYRHEPNSYFLEAILLRIFGINELPQHLHLSERSDRYWLFASKLTLAINKVAAQQLVQNINAKFPGAAKLLNPGQDSDDPTLINTYEISIDNDILQGPLFDLYKVKLAELAANEPNFIEQLQINCGTRQRTSEQLADFMQTVAGRFQQQPTIAASITHFSSVLRQNKRTARDLIEADDQLNRDLKRHESELYDCHDREAVKKLKDEKQCIKEVRKELDLVIHRQSH